ncbi:MAG: hypothetical protein AABY95_09230 [Pseudomonadota bacterium]
MKHGPSLLLLLSVLELAACASNAHCRRPQSYQSAGDRPPLTGVDGLELKESAGALRIPPPVENPVAFGQQSGDTWSCLDLPPKLQLPEDKPKS